MKCHSWQPAFFALALMFSSVSNDLRAQEWGPPVVSNNAPAMAVRLPAVTPVSQAQVTALEARLIELEQKLELKEAAEKEQGYEVGSDLGMTASWKNGLEIQSKNKDFRVHVGGRQQVDAVWLNGSQNGFVNAGGVGDEDSVNFRRSRLRVDGEMYEFMEWAVEYDFVNSINQNNGVAPTTENNVVNVPAPTDLWVRVKELPVVGNFQVGNMKEPLGLEHATSSRYLDFMERSYNQDAFTGTFNNGFSPGVMIFDNWNDKNGTWAAGVFKNTQNGYAFDTGDGEYAATSRVTWLPWYDEPSEGRYLLHLGVSGSYRDTDQDRLRIRSRGSLRNGPGPLNPVFADTGNFNCDSQGLIGGEVALVYGPWLWQSEYMASFAQDAVGNGTTSVNGADLGTIQSQGYYTEVMYFLTGEHRAYDHGRGAFTRVVPHENFYLVRDAYGSKCFSRGAWQVGVRYSVLDLNDPGMNAGYLQDITVGLNWFLNPNMKWQFNYDYMVRDAQGIFAGPPPEGYVSGFGTRFAWDF